MFGIALFKMLCKAIKNIIFAKNIFMKKILALFLLLTLAACDDGDMSFDTFNFGNSAPSRCGDSNIYFKINGTEVLILNIPPANLANIPSETELVDGQLEYQPRIISLSGTNSIIYRNYDGAVTGQSNLFCTDIPAASPSVLQEWQGSGTLGIATAPVINTETQRITGYRHTVILLDVSFNRDGETVRIIDSNFGSITTPLGYTFDFGSEQDEAPIPIYECENGLVFNRRGQEALVLDFGPENFPTQEGTFNPINLETDTENTIRLYVYSGTITNNNICSNQPVVTPTLTAIWRATQGQVEITSIADTNSATGYRYQIRFYDIEFENSSRPGEVISGISNTDLGDYYYFGEYIPQN